MLLPKKEEGRRKKEEGRRSIKRASFCSPVLARTGFDHQASEDSTQTKNAFYKNEMLPLSLHYKPITTNP